MKKRKLEDYKVSEYFNKKIKSKEFVEKLKEIKQKIKENKKEGLREK